MRNFRDLLVWQKSRALLLRLDSLADAARPRHPRLADQLRRSAESIPACIAEGSGRATDKDFAHYLSMAAGSTSEVENHLERVGDFNLVTAEERDSLVADTIEVRKMIHGLMKKVVRK